MIEDFESLIRRYVILNKPTAKGFHSVKCQVCNDYKERGGFKFEGDQVGYSCFNCGSKARYDGKNLSKNMKEILIAFGIPEDEIKRASVKYFFEKGNQLKEFLENQGLIEKVIPLPTKEVPLPKDSHLISTDDSPWCEVAREYLNQRGLDPLASPYYVSDDKSYLCRVIIPYFFKGKIMYWQGRSMDSSVEPRYKNPVADKDCIFYNMDELYKYGDAPLFVTEGPLDAESIGSLAVATLGSSLSDFQIQELKKVALRRRVIFVIDKNRNGYKLGMQVLGWDLPNVHVACLPDNIEDANDALQKLGKLFMTAHLVESAANGLQGKLLLEMKCSKKKQ